jgi:rhodanese-related sulfurtransferase
MLLRGLPRIVLLDVRVPTQYGICHLPDSINVPLSQLQPRLAELDTAISSVSSGGDTVKGIRFPAFSNHGTVCLAEGGSVVVYALCRRGIDSLKAVEVSGLSVILAFAHRTSISCVPFACSCFED